MEPSTRDLFDDPTLSDDDEPAIKIIEKIFLKGPDKPHVVIPKGFTSIGEYAFFLHNRVSSVDLPSSLTSIGDHAFSLCSGLTSVVLPEGLTSIGGRAFKGCTGLTSVVFPSTLTSIGRMAFKGCTALSVLVPPCRVAPNRRRDRRRGVAPDSFKDCYLVLNASGHYIDGSVVINPIIIGLRKRLLALWSQNVRRQGRLRQTSKDYKIPLSGNMLGYERMQANRESNEVTKIWREIKQILERDLRLRLREVGKFLFAKIFKGGERLVRMKSYLNQPMETKVFQRVLQDLGITDSGGRLELRF